VVLNEAELSSMNRPLLDALRLKLPGMTVTRTDLCPEVVLRGKSTVLTSSSPRIYVDGNRAVNTCVLQELRTVDLVQVEVYPGGTAPRAGYQSYPYGVILIFVRRSE
jgi:hypothetical protein